MPHEPWVSSLQLGSLGVACPNAHLDFQEVLLIAT